MSDGFVESTGWRATISCTLPCQDIIAHIDPVLTLPNPNDGYIGICPNGEVHFSAYGEYSQNNFIYAQSDATSLFEWNFGDGTTATGPNVSHTYSNSGGYGVTLNITDSRGCISTNSIETRVVIAGSPFAGITQPPAACAYDTLELLFTFDESSAGSVIQGDTFIVSTQTTLGVSDTTYLPDGTGVCYSTSVTFDCFGQGQELENAWDILNLCANMEHSFLGDLEISLICPNGQSIILKEFMSTSGATGQGGGTNLGTPDQLDNGVPGIGIDYCWSTSPAMGTMVAESANYGVLPSGSYAPFETFYGLVGCPLNGTWTIQICDNWALDDGFIFSWYLELNPDIAPDNWSYEVGIDQMGWTDGPFIIDETPNSLIINPTAAGQFEYIYTIIDEFGCQWDTTAELTVLAAPIVDLGEDINYCDNTASALLDAGNPGCTYIWNNGAISQTLNVTSSGTYSVTVSNTQCTVVDTIEINFGGFQFDYTSLNANCYNSSDGSIDITVSSLYPPYNYLWSNGATSQDLTNITSGTYHVTISDAGFCSTVQTIVIDQPQALDLTSVITHNDCHGNQIGAVNITPQGGTLPYTYLWSNGALTEDVNTLAAQTIQVTITDNNNCHTSESFTINEPAELVATITPQNILCFGDINGQANLNVTGGTHPYSYNWNNGSNNEDLSGLSAGNYSVIVTDHNLCQTSASTTITSVSAPLETALTPTHLLCYGYNNGNIINAVQGGTPPYSFIWSSGQGTQDIASLVAGNYSVTITDHNGCIITDNTTITQPAAITTSLSPNQTICINQSATISASVTGGTSPYTYMWNTGSVVSSINVSPQQTTAFTIVVTDANGCSTSKTSTVSIHDSLHLNISLDDYYICKGEAVTINGTYSGGNGGPYTIRLNGDIVSLPYDYMPAQSQTLTVCINDMCTTPQVCDDAHITVNELPIAAFLPDITEGCQPLSVQFTSWGDNDITTYSWDFGDPNGNNYSANRNPLHVFNHDGIFDVSLTVTDTSGCKSTFAYENLITVYPIPDAKFIAEPSVVSILTPQIYFNNQSQLAHNYYWYFGDGDSSDIVSPYHKYPAVGTYIVQLIASSDHGCKDTASMQIIVEDVNSFYAPTAFSPNSNGVNDMFFISGEGIDPNKFSMTIYDRWGEMIFQTDKYNPENPSEFGWDGRVKKNNFAPIGVYTWLVRYFDETGNVHEKAGVVTIIR
ncbi:MAG: hypothetical protein CVU05_04980 [Bacteroidetes bacterium HGW-Bacteroidetes-21]|nr:MAG: hypothetical protein CVU05_04980 [Bacteroidetes bacterium HGW-Bacteroidetes-21]